MVIDVCATPTINKTIDVADLTKSNAKQNRDCTSLDVLTFTSFFACPFSLTEADEATQ